MAYFDETGLPTNTPPAWLSKLPAFSFAPPASTSNLVSAGLSSGLHQAAAGLGGAGEAVGALTGLKGLQDASQGFQESQSAAATAAERPDLENASFFNPKRIAYKLLQGAPQLGAGLIGGAIGSAGGPAGAFAGAAAATLPFTTGANVQEAREASGGAPLSTSDAGKALGLGIPEALAAGYAGPTKMAQMFEHGIEGSIAKRIFVGGGHMAALQGAIGAGQEAITQQAYHPDMTFADRARGIVSAALESGVQGGVIGGAIGALRPLKNAAPGDLVNKPDVMNAAVDAATQPSPPPPEATPPGPPNYAQVPSDQLMAMYQPWSDKGAGRLPQEEDQFQQIKTELTKRTPPGNDVGQGTLFTPEEVAARQPQVDAFREKVLPPDVMKTFADADNKSFGADSPFLSNFNATNEPELINLLKATPFEKGDNPQSVLALRYGVDKDGTSMEALKKLTDLQNQVTSTEQARNAALSATGPWGTATAAADSALATLRPQLVKARQLIDWHNQAEVLKGAPPPETDTLAVANDNLTKQAQALEASADVQTGPAKVDALTKAKDIRDNQIPKVEASQDAVATAEQGSTPLPKVPPGIPARLASAYQGFEDAKAIDSPNKEKIVAAANDIQKQIVTGGDGLRDQISAAKANIKKLSENKPLEHLNAAVDRDQVKTEAAPPAPAVPVAPGAPAAPAQFPFEWLRTEVAKDLAMPDADKSFKSNTYRSALETMAGKYPELKPQLDKARVADHPGESLLSSLNEMKEGKAALPTPVTPKGSVAVREVRAMNGIRKKAGLAGWETATPDKLQSKIDQTKALIDAHPDAATRPGLETRLLTAPRERLAKIRETQAVDPRAFEPPPVQRPVSAVQADAERAEVKKELLDAYGSLTKGKTGAPVSIRDLIARAEQGRAGLGQLRHYDAEDIRRALTDLHQNSGGRYALTQSPGLFDPTRGADRAASVQLGDPRTAVKSGSEFLIEPRSTGQNQLMDQFTDRGADFKPQEAPQAAAKLKERLSPAVERTKLEALHAAEPEGPVKERLSKALADKDPVAVRRMLNAMELLAKDRGVSPTPEARTSAEAERPPVEPEPAGKTPEAAAADASKAEWDSDLAAHAKDTQGKVVYQDADHALVQGHNLMGEPVYIPVNRASGTRMRVDIIGAKVGGWLTQGVKDQLVAERRKALASEDAAAKARPDGPFQGKDGQVVGSPSVDPKMVDYARGLLKEIGLGKLRILVMDRTDMGAADDMGLRGDYNPARTVGMKGGQGEARTMGPGRRDFYVSVDKSLDPQEQIEVMSHEIGHIIEKVALNNATPEVKAAIDAAHQTWFKQVSGMKGQDLINTVRNRMSAARNEALTHPDKQLGPRDQAYFTSKAEWFADNVSRWATTADKPVSLVDRFFSAVASKLRALLTAITGDRFLPNTTVEDFMNKMVARSGEQSAADAWLEPKGGKVDDNAPSLSRTPQESESRVAGASRAADDVYERVMNVVTDRATDMWGPIRKFFMGWARTPDLARIADMHGMDTAQRFWDTTSFRDTLVDLKSKGFEKGLSLMYKLDKSMFGKVQTFLINQQATPGINGRIAWGDHSDAIKSRPDSANLAAKHAELSRLHDAIRQGGGKPALDSYLQAAQTARLQEITGNSQKIFDRYAAKGQPLEGGGYNKDRLFAADPSLPDKPDALNQAYMKYANDMLSGMRKRIKEVDDAASKIGDPKQRKAAEDDVGDLRHQLALSDRAMEQATSGTYAPLSRTGDYFVSGRLARGADGKIVPEAARALEDALVRNGFDNVGILGDSDDSTVMTRVESQSQMNRMAKLFDDLKTQGHIDRASTIKNGYAADLDSMSKIGSQFISQQIEALKTILGEVGNKGGKGGLSGNERSQIMQQMVSQLLEMMPDHALARSLQQRRLSSGFDTDMARNMAWRLRVSAKASTGMSMSGEIASAQEAMKQQVLKEKEYKTGGTNNPTLFQDFANEFIRRETEKSVAISSNLFSGLQKVAHTVTVGANIPYVLTATSQIPTLLQPELAKTHGYVPSWKAVAGATPRAFKALNAIFQSEDASKIGIREEAFRAAGIPERDIETLMKLENAGGLTQTFTRSMIETGEGVDPRGAKWHQWANAMGGYSELFPRILGALAAGDLHDAAPQKAQGKTREQFIKDVVNNSQFEWGPGSYARFTSGKGLFGPASKVVLGFMQYHLSMMAKMYTEAHALLSKNSTPEERKASGAFLLSHLAATTVLAGTLALPFAGAIAGAYNRFSDYLGDKDDTDIEGSYRTWLAGTFGKAAGDAITKGLPRMALGIDLSHLGDQNMLPFSSMIASKRKLEDAWKDETKSMAGSAPNEIINMTLGLRDMLNGDYAIGATKLLPEGLRGLAEAYRLDEFGGYVDRNNTKLPIKQGDLDTLKLALGFEPAQEKQYEEGARMLSGLKADRQYREQNISRHLEMAITANDPASLNAWMGEAVKYVRDHPGMGNPLARMQAVLSQRIQGAAMARATGMPIGVKPQDFDLQSRLGFVDTAQ